MRLTRLWSRVVADLAYGALKLPKWQALPNTFQQPRTVTADFIGVNIATSGDPACDDYVVEALRELDIRQVRMSFSYESFGGDAQRLLERVLNEDFEVMLSVFPPVDDARRLTLSMDALERWSAFVQKVANEYGPRIRALELGNTPNRGRWSGFDAVGFLNAWQAAVDAVGDAEIILAGPNVSDFEPLYNLGLIRGMVRRRRPPSIHTDNLFVERVVQPEAFDHRALGAWATDVLRLNLAKKANILCDVSTEMGAEQTMCTYTCWTRKRLLRSNVDPDQIHANYLVRYLVIAAANTSLDRVYWGPLICHRDGLIDDGDKAYPQIDHVAHYKSVRGNVSAFRKTKAFEALGHIQRLLRGATCIYGSSGPKQLNCFVFEREAQKFHILWCADRAAYPLSELYDASDLAAADISTPAGLPSRQEHLSVTEQPLFLSWPVERCVSTPNSPGSVDLGQHRKSLLIHGSDPTVQTQRINTPDWQGAVNVPAGQNSDSFAERLMPVAIDRLTEKKVLRDKRNRVWNVQVDPANNNQLTIKLNRAKGMKRISYRFLPSKARRHWNNATEMLRRGVNTPKPIAFFERTTTPGVANNYYIAEFVPDAFSCRDVFTAFAQGATTYRGIDKTDWLKEISQFVAGMHSQRVFHRDLSSGNLMMTQTDERIAFYLIDIGRAVVDLPPNTANRMRDVNRICFKLDWSDRETFVAAYVAAGNVRLKPWWRLWLHAYDWKQGSKRSIKGRSKALVANGKTLD